MKSTLTAKIFILGLLCLPTAHAAQQLSPGEINDLSYQAGLLFRQANDLIKTSPSQAHQLYDQAILRYRRIIEEAGVANGHLYYNIANAHLLKGDIGRAILNYRRAQRLIPDNADLARNLDFARRQRLDQVPIKAQKRVLHTLFFWHYDFADKTKFSLTGCLWTLACLAGSVWFWSRRGRLFLWLMVISFLVALCFAASVAVDRYNFHTHRQGVVIAESVIARQGDGDNYPVSFTEPLHSGTEFDLLEERRDWLRFELSSGDQAWIPAAAADII